MFWKKQCKTYEKIIECFIGMCDSYAKTIDKLRGEIKLRDEVIDHQNELLELYREKNKEN